MASGREADRAGAHLRKGRAVFVEGRLDYVPPGTAEARRSDRLHVVAQRLTLLPRAVGAQPRAAGSALAVPAWLDQEGRAMEDLADVVQLDLVPLVASTLKEAARLATAIEGLAREVNQLSTDAGELRATNRLLGALLTQLGDSPNGGAS